MVQLFLQQHRHTINVLYYISLQYFDYSATLCAGETFHSLRGERGQSNSPFFQTLHIMAPCAPEVSEKPPRTGSLSGCVCPHTVATFCGRYQVPSSDSVFVPLRCRQSGSSGRPVAGASFRVVACSPLIDPFCGCIRMVLIGLRYKRRPK